MTTRPPAATEISMSLRLGLEVESDDPTMVDAIPELTQKQIEWIGSWLAGEGFTR